MEIRPEKNSPFRNLQSMAFPPPAGSFEPSCPSCPSWPLSWDLDNHQPGRTPSQVLLLPKNIERTVFVDAWGWGCQAPDGTVFLISCYSIDTPVLRDNTDQGQGRTDVQPQQQGGMSSKCISNTKAEIRMKLYCAFFTMCVLVNFCICKDTGNQYLIWAWWREKGKILPLLCLWIFSFLDISGFNLLIMRWTLSSSISLWRWVRTLLSLDSDGPELCHYVPGDLGLQFPLQRNGIITPTLWGGV